MPLTIHLSTSLLTDKFIPWAAPTFWGAEREYVLDALTSTWISGGPYVERFERELKEKLESPHVLAVANGTAALHVAYVGAGLKAGDEVIVPSYAFMGAANVAAHLGMRPVFCDVDPDTWCATPETIAAALTPRTRAIVAVHTYGNVCHVPSIEALAESHGVVLIEDAAESFGSKIAGRQSGTVARFGTFSFHATKTITTGEGGGVATSDPDAADLMSVFRSHGMRRRVFYWHDMAGHNFRLTNIQAALGCAQLQHIDNVVARRKQLQTAYQERLGAQPGVKPQLFAEDVDPVLWTFAVELEASAFPQGRDEVLRQMQSAGIECRPGFYSASELPMYAAKGCETAAAVGKAVICLPTYPGLADTQLDRICETFLRLRR